MRASGWLVAALIALGWIASNVDADRLSPGPPLAPIAPWRRTCDGWQRADWLAMPPPEQRLFLHPGWVAIAQILAMATLECTFGGNIKPKNGRVNDAHARS